MHVQTFVDLSSCRATNEPPEMLFLAIEHGDETAAGQFWEHTFPFLVRYFRRRYGMLPRPVVDEEDLALAVVHDLFCEIRQGCLHDVSSWDQFRRVACTRARQTFADQRKADHRLKRARNRNAFGTGQALDAVSARVDAPDALSDLKDDLFALLRDPRDKELRAMLLLLFTGLSKGEIAAALECTLRTVNRRLKRLHGLWLNRLGVATL